MDCDRYLSRGRYRAVGDSVFGEGGLGMGEKTKNTSDTVML